MNVLIRTDASNEIGTGHLTRCLTLAEALRGRGARCRFVCRAHPGHLIEKIRQRGFEGHALPQHPDGRPGETPHHAAWLGADWAVDAEETKLCAGETAYDWLIVDHYAIDARWETMLRARAKRILVIDDLADRPHACEVLLDQNWFGENAAQRYQDRVPAHCRLLLGPRYALLHPDFAETRQKLRWRDGTVKRVLVFMGGSDTGNVTAKVLDVLDAEEFRFLEVEVVLGPNHPDPRGIVVRAARRPHTRVLQNLPSLAAPMAWADLMIGGGGTVSWERACLGLPAITISVADNQTPIQQALAEEGAVLFLGNQESIEIDQISSALRELLTHPEKMRAMVEHALCLTDGAGAEKLANVMCAGSGDNVAWEA